MGSTDRGLAGRLGGLLASEHRLLWLCLATAAVAAVAVPGFATVWNGQTLLVYALPMLVAAVGLTLVMIAGGIDLSITSIMAVVSVTGAQVMSAERGWLAGHELAVPAAVLAMLATGALLGAVNGWCVSKLEIPPFIATLTTMTILGGGAIWLTRSEKIGGLPESFRAAGQNVVGVGLAVAALVVVGQVLLDRSVGGRWLRAVGWNGRAARQSGVPVSRVVMGSYVASGLTAALAAIILTAGLETGDPVMARDRLLDIVGATVLGGTSLHGGRGRVVWTVYGVLFLALLENVLNLLNVTYAFVTICKGAVILGAAMLDGRRER